MKTIYKGVMRYVANFYLFNKALFRTVKALPGAIRDNFKENKSYDDVQGGEFVKRYGFLPFPVFLVLRAINITWHSSNIGLSNTPIFYQDHIRMVGCNIFAEISTISLEAGFEIAPYEILTDVSDRIAGQTLSGAVMSKYEDIADDVIDAIDLRHPYESILLAMYNLKLIKFDAVTELHSQLNDLDTRMNKHNAAFIKNLPYYLTLNENSLEDHIKEHGLVFPTSIVKPLVTYNARYDNINKQRKKAGV